MATVGFLILNLLLDLAISSPCHLPPTEEGPQEHVPHTAGNQAFAFCTTRQTQTNAFPLPTHWPRLLPQIKSLEL